MNTIEGLNKLLADYNILYINLRGLHWNIKGHKFFELHLKFEELYNNTADKVDEVAERILALGATPLHSYTDYLAISRIKEEKNINLPIDAVKSIKNQFEILVVAQKELHKETNGELDIATTSLLEDYIKEQEKLIWMFDAFLN